MKVGDVFAEGDFVDAIGMPQKGEQGRSASDKKIRVVIAIEERNGKSGRAPKHRGKSNRGLQLCFFTT